MLQCASSALPVHLDVRPAGVGEGNVAELDVGPVRAALGLGMPCRHHLGRPIQQCKHPCAGPHSLSCTACYDDPGKGPLACNLAKWHS